MTCGVDPIAWGEKNRVRLSTGKTHEWVLARTTRDRPTLDTLPMTTRAVMSKWFEGTPIDVLYADAGEAVDAVSVLSVSDSLPVPPSKAQRREQLDPLPFLAPGPTPPLFVRVAFHYRGYVKSLPWPVWTASGTTFLRESKLCPQNCDWMLVWAKSEDELTEAPPEASALDKLAQNAPGGLADLARLTQLAGYALVAYLGFQAFTVARTFTPKRSR